MRRFLSLLGVWLGLQASNAVAQYSFDFNAYYRTGIGYSRSNVDQVCYNQPGWPDLIPRLGNECGNYGEFMFYKNYKPQGENPKAPWMRGGITFSLAADGNQSEEKTRPENRPAGAGESSQFDFDWANRELYIEGINFFGEGSRIWVGKRFYRRLHIPIWDFFILQNNGSGFGLMDYSVGSGHLSVAWLRRTSNADDSQPFHNNFDLRYAFPVGKSKLELIAIAGEQAPLDHRSGERKWIKVPGQSLTINWEHNERPYQYKIIGQVGKGLYGARPDHYQGGWSTGATVGRFDEQAFADSDPAAVERAEAWKKSASYRLVTNLLWNPDANYYVDMAAFYGVADFGGRKDSQGEELENRNTFAIGARPTYMFSDHHSIEADYYYSLIENGVPYQDRNFQTKYDGKPIDRELHKLTMAYVLRPLPFEWAKPVIRFYGTVAKWNDKTKGDNYLTGYLRPLYENKTTGYTIGVMGEAWL
ncbi:MAG: carbohydrate porin [Oligoflexus sp.]